MRVSYVEAEAEGSGSVSSIVLGTEHGDCWGRCFGVRVNRSPKKRERVRVYFIDSHREQKDKENDCCEDDFSVHCLLVFLFQQIISNVDATKRGLIHGENSGIVGDGDSFKEAVGKGDSAWPSFSFFGGSPIA